MTQSPQDIIMRQMLAELSEQIEAKNKDNIDAMYETIGMLNFMYISDDLLDKYDKLVEQGNDILYE